MPTIAGASLKQAGRYYDKGGLVINALHPEFGIKADETDDLVGLTALATYVNALTSPCTVEFPATKFDASGNASPAIYGLSAKVQFMSKYKINVRFHGSVAEDTPFGSFIQPLANFTDYMLEWKAPGGGGRFEGGGGDIRGIAFSDRSNTGAATTKQKRQYTMVAALGLTDWLWSKLENSHFTYLKGGAFRTESAVMSSAKGNIVRLCGDTGHSPIDLNGIAGGFITQSFVLEDNKVEQNYDAVYVNVGALAGNVKILDNGMESGFIVDHAGTGNVSSASGTATFVTSQAGVLSVGSWIDVAGTYYQLLTFNGTTSATLSGAPTFGASSFGYLSANEKDDNSSAQKFVLMAGNDGHIALNHFNRNSQTAVHVTGQNNITSANNFNGHVGISYLSSNIGNSLVGGNEFHGCTGSPTTNNASFTVSASGTGASVNGNTFYFSGGILLTATGSSVNDNTMYAPQQTIGLYFIDISASGGAQWNTVEGNTIYCTPTNTTTGGIRMTAVGGTLCGNSVFNALKGLQIDGTGITVTGNGGLATCTTPIGGTGDYFHTNTIDNNGGVKSRNSGTGAIGAAATSVTINHGLPYTPVAADVQTWFAASGLASTSCWADTFTATQMTLHTNAAPGGAGTTVGWKAQSPII